MTADLGPVASIFWLDEALGSRIRLDGIVACVDAKNILSQLESTSSAPMVDVDEDESVPSGGGDEAARQIAFADRVIVNKIDLLECQNTVDVEKKTIETVLQEIMSINPTAPVITTTYSKIKDINWIIDAKCFDADRVKDIEYEFRQSIGYDATEISESSAQHLSINTNNKCNSSTCIECNSPRGSTLCRFCCDKYTSNIPINKTHHHTNAVGTVALFGCGSIDLHKINSWLASILWPDQDEMDKVLRARLEENLKTSHGKEVKESRKRNIFGKKRKQDIYRVKGVLSVCHAVDEEGHVVPASNDWIDDGLTAGAVNPNGLDGRRFIVQAVNELWDVRPASSNLCWNPNETRCCKIVVIGKCLEEFKLKEGFDSCFTT